MSNPYTPTILPDVIAVHCPCCAAEARFEFASYMPIRERQYIEYFKKSDHFEYVHNPGHGQGTVHMAVYFHGLNGNTLHAVNDLPEPFETAHWDHKWQGLNDRMYRFFDQGVVSCASCSLRRKHQLKWPSDAWFQIEYRGLTLWAYNRDSTTVLKSFIAADDRSFQNFTHRKFLMKVPAHFLDAKARAPVLKKLEARLRA